MISKFENDLQFRKEGSSWNIIKHVARHFSLKLDKYQKLPYCTRYGWCLIKLWNRNLTYIDKIRKIGSISLLHYMLTAHVSTYIGFGITIYSRSIWEGILSATAALHPDPGGWGTPKNAYEIELELRSFCLPRHPHRHRITLHRISYSIPFFFLLSFSFSFFICPPCICERARNDLHLLSQVIVGNDNKVVRLPITYTGSLQVSRLGISTP